MTDRLGNAHAARRIVLHGVTGSGKTTAAHLIGQAMGLPVIDADAMVWLPGWRAVSRDAQIHAFGDAIRQPKWVLDQTGPDDSACDAADLVILLDYPRWLSFRRLLSRSVLRVVRRTEVCNGNYETWRKVLSSDSTLAWHFRSWRQRREEIEAMSGQYGEKAVRFKRPAELRAWIDALQSNSMPSRR